MIQTARFYLIMNLSFGIVPFDGINTHELCVKKRHALLEKRSF